MFSYSSSEDRLSTIWTFDRRSWVLERRAAVELYRERRGQYVNEEFEQGRRQLAFISDAGRGIAAD